jgi:hypothetical protein
MDLYLDMDGVLANFDKKATELLGTSFTDKYYWEGIPKAKKGKMISDALDYISFWVSLEPMPDFDTLWGFAKYFQPRLLTAYPKWSVEAIETSKKGKWQWNMQNTMVPENRFHVVARQEKKNYALNNDGPNVLVDDHEENIEEWNRAGGFGILHTNAADSVKRLKELGFKK